MTRFRLLGVITLLLSFSFTPGWAQRPPIQSPADANDRAELEAEMQRKSQEQQQKKRFEEMKRDSQRLLELATELKQYVDKTGEDILSLEVIRKAEELEKLSRQVKNNMRGD
jgi:hypothetical protein